MKTTVVNVKDLSDNWPADPSYVYCGRPSLYGNPHRRLCFACNRSHDRYEAVRLHAQETREKYKADQKYRELVEKLRGKKLVCYCKREDVDVVCHCDVYVELLEGDR